jgi:hypothetical protein
VKAKDEMTRTALFFHQSQMNKLKLLSESTGAPVAELIRRAVDMYLEARKSEIPKK